MRKKRYGGTPDKKRTGKSTPKADRELSLDAQSWLHDAKTCLNGGQGTVDDDSRLVAALAQLEAAEVPVAVRELTQATGEQSLPLLQYMTTQDEPNLSYAATDALGLVAELEAAAILGGVHRNSSNKQLRKRARKSLTRLKSLGLDVDSFLEDTGESFAISHLPSTTPNAWVSTIDGAGNQLVIYSKIVPMEGLYALHAVTNDKLGIVSGTGGRTSKRQLRHFNTHVSSEDEVELLEVDPEYARYLLTVARKLNTATDTPVPSDYVSLSFLLGDEEIAGNPVDIDSLLSANGSIGDADDGRKPEAILRENAFALWSLPHEISHKYVEQIKEIDEGWVITSGDVEEDRIKNLLNSATDFIFSMEERQLYRARLANMAYLLHLQDKPDVARDALQVAEMLGDESREAHLIPFARALVAGSIVADYDRHCVADEPDNDEDEEEQQILLLSDDTVKILRSTVV